MAFFQKKNRKKMQEGISGNLPVNLSSLLNKKWNKC